MEREENKGSLVSHPMRERSAAYRYRYCFGLGVLAMGNIRNDLCVLILIRQ